MMKRGNSGFPEQIRLRNGNSSTMRWIKWTKTWLTRWKFLRKRWPDRENKLSKLMRKESKEWDFNARKKGKISCCNWSMQGPMLVLMKVMTRTYLTRFPSSRINSPKSSYKLSVLKINIPSWWMRTKTCKIMLWDLKTRWQLTEVLKLKWRLWSLN